MKCEYRNCEITFDYRSNKKFCSRSCKNKEAVYKFRERQKDENKINKGISTRDK